MRHKNIKYIEKFDHIWEERIFGYTNETDLIFSSLYRVDYQNDYFLI